MHNYFVYIGLSYAAFALVTLVYLIWMRNKHRRTIRQIRLELAHVEPA